MKYKLLKDRLSQEVYGAIKYNEDGSYTSFLFSGGNQYYLDYQEWLAEGNTPEPADTPPAE